jgi:hypothetical protein
MAADAPVPLDAVDGAPTSDGELCGILHVFVAFDWGEEVDLERAKQLVPAEVLALPRRRRTPSSFGYRPPPLRINLAPVPLELARLGRVEATAGVTVFDFAAVSVALRVPFRLPAEALGELAGALAEPAALVQAARAAATHIHTQLLPAIQNPFWPDNLSEDYIVFELPPGGPLPSPDQFMQAYPGETPLIAHLVHLETGPLSGEEVAEALRLHLRYGPDDLVVLDWAAAVLVDRDCDETLQAIEFANLQLLELRHIDERLDQSLAAAYRLIHPLARSWLPFWRMHARPIRVLGELKVEANDLFERTGNALKLIGDPYLARVYRLLATRFHLETWEQSIQRNLEVAEGVYQVVSDQATSFRMELLEIIIVVLILFEVIMAFVRH